MKKIIHRAGSRGVAEHGWLHSRHTFSFANYYNPDRMNFGKLRVLNDDIIEASAGFDTHPHENMEIISIPISGELRHADSMGNTFIIRENEVQIMSAGTGIKHSEYNNSTSNPTNFLQLWILPKQLNIEPRYAQHKYEVEQRHNRFLTIVSPNQENSSLPINQDAWLKLGNFDANKKVEYEPHQDGNGLYVFVISGQIVIDNETLDVRDAVGITNSNEISLQATQASQILTIEVPMN